MGFKKSIFLKGDPNTGMEGGVSGSGGGEFTRLVMWGGVQRPYGHALLSAVFICVSKTFKLQKCFGDSNLCCFVNTTPNENKINKKQI